MRSLSLRRRLRRPRSSRSPLRLLLRRLPRPLSCLRRVLTLVSWVPLRPRWPVVSRLSLPLVAVVADASSLAEAIVR